MNRREFFSSTAIFALAVLTQRTFAQAKPLTDKDILSDKIKSNLPEFCHDPEKQPNKMCPGAKDKAGANCGKCQFYNMDKSETTFKGKKYARCQLLADPSKPQFVATTDYCGSFFKKA